MKINLYTKLVGGRMNTQTKEENNKLMSQIPEDDEGFMTGTFTITVSWEQE